MGLGCALAHRIVPMPRARARQAAPNVPIGSGCALEHRIVPMARARARQAAVGASDLVAVFAHVLRSVNLCRV